VESRVVKVEGQVSLPFDVRQGLAGGQVVDGDFVSLPGSAGEEDIAADGHGIIRGSLQAEEAAFGDVDAVPQPAADAGVVPGNFTGGRVRGRLGYLYDDGIAFPALWGEGYGRFLEWFTVQGVDHDAGKSVLVVSNRTTTAVSYACLAERSGSGWR
jgi:hypothetical protein